MVTTLLPSLCDLLGLASNSLQSRLPASCPDFSLVSPCDAAHALDAPSGSHPATPVPYLGHHFPNSVSSGPKFSSIEVQQKWASSRKPSLILAARDITTPLPPAPPCLTPTPALGASLRNTNSAPWLHSYLRLPQPTERPRRAQLHLTASDSSLLHRHGSPLRFKGRVLAPFSSHMDNRPEVCSMAQGVRDCVLLSMMKPICLHMSVVNKKSLHLPWMIQEAPRFTSPGLGAAAPHGHGCLCFCSGLWGHSAGQLTPLCPKKTHQGGETIYTEAPGVPGFHADISTPGHTPRSHVVVRFRLLHAMRNPPRHHPSQGREWREGNWQTV